MQENENFSGQRCIYARPHPLPVPENELKKLGRKRAELMELIERFLRAGNGIGYALDSADLQPLLACRHSMRRKTLNVIRKIPPEHYSLPKEAFLELQREAYETQAEVSDASVCGIFSCDESGQLYQGWYQDANRKKLEVGDEWAPVLRRLGRGSFLLEGYQVLQYRRKYGGWIVPLVLELT